MDAQYLKLNVNDALAEALTSMAVSLPDDGVEYVGNYLLQYVERRHLQQKTTDAFKGINEKAKVEAERDAQAAVVAEEKQAVVDSKQKELDDFVAGLTSVGATKQEATDAVTAFLSEYLKVPAVYVAEKRVAGESETLNYISANPTQAHVVGKKLKKPAEDIDPEEMPARQGCSFEAFKLPVVEEPEEPEEGEDAPPPPPPPVAQPLIIDNVMRDTRVQFFGIPKLGSYVAVPFSYNSCDHAAGCQKAEAAAPVDAEPEEGAEPVAVSEPSSPYVKNGVSVQLIIASDTIGEFRRYSKKDISIIQLVGEALLRRYEALEDALFQQQVEYITQAAAGSGPLAALIAALGDEEATAVAAATVQPEIPEDAPDEVKEEMTLPPYTESVARANFYTQKVILSEFADATISYSGYVLPPPLPVMQLFYAVGLLCGADAASLCDPCGDLSWDQIKTNFVLNSVSMMHVYDCLAKAEVAAANSCANVKAYCENNNIFDASAYPPEMASLSVINTWLQKNLAARETTIAFFKETKNEDLETVTA